MSSHCKCNPLEWTDRGCLLYLWLPLCAHDGCNLKPYNSNLRGIMAFCYESQCHILSVQSFSFKDQGIHEWVHSLLWKNERRLFSTAVFPNFSNIWRQLIYSYMSAWVHHMRCPLGGISSEWNVFDLSWEKEIKRKIWRTSILMMSHGTILQQMGLYWS